MVTDFLIDGTNYYFKCGEKSLKRATDRGCEVKVIHFPARCPMTMFQTVPDTSSYVKGELHRPQAGEALTPSRIQMWGSPGGLSNQPPYPPTRPPSLEQTGQSTQTLSSPTVVSPLGTALSVGGGGGVARGPGLWSRSTLPPCLKSTQ
ncbi:hypothetical protein SRHO_G00079020 [Serrasalmus rhombeus]